MAMIALGTLASAATMFAATAVPDGRFFFDAFTAVQLGAMLVAASASAIARPAFFAFAGAAAFGGAIGARSEEHTSELQSLMRISYAVFSLKKKNIHKNTTNSKVIPH